MGLHREQSRGKIPRDPLVLLLSALSLQCHSLNVTQLWKLHIRKWIYVCACVFCQVFDGAVIVLSLAPMVASTVANGPSSPWDAIGLIITLRIWRVKTIIDGETGRGLRGWCPLRPVLYSQVAEMDTAVRSLRSWLHSILGFFAQFFSFSHQR